MIPSRDAILDQLPVVDLVDHHHHHHLRKSGGQTVMSHLKSHLFQTANLMKMVALLVLMDNFALLVVLVTAVPADLDHLTIAEVKRWKDGEVIITIGGITGGIIVPDLVDHADQFQLLHKHLL